MINLELFNKVISYLNHSSDLNPYDLKSDIFEFYLPIQLYPGTDIIRLDKVDKYFDLYSKLGIHHGGYSAIIADFPNKELNDVLWIDNIAELDSIFKLNRTIANQYPGLYVALDRLYKGFSVILVDYSLLNGRAPIQPKLEDFINKWKQDSRSLVE